MRAITLILLTFFALMNPEPTEAKAKSSRKPAALTSKLRVITIACREPNATMDRALALAFVPVDSSSKAFTMSLYLKSASDGSYLFKQLTGTVVAEYSDGIVLRSASWGPNSGDAFILHAHPRDLTVFPGS